jgi:RNA polymerase sporulation-specific sigma factor
MNMSRIWKYRLRQHIVQLLVKIGFQNDEIYYINGSEALPPPLSRDEEEHLLQGLVTGAPDIRGKLIERNLRLVVYIARKFENTGNQIEDLISIGTIGLIKAVNTFDPLKKIKLATYASRCIENEILMHFRKTSKMKSEVSFDEPLNVDWDGNELLLSDVLGTENDVIHRELEQQVDRAILHRALGQLSTREKSIMEMRFGLLGGDEKTQKDVADLMGISQSYISRLEKRIIHRLRKEFNKMV